MAAKEKSSKKEPTLMSDNIEAIFERRVKEGSNLTPVQRNFLKEVAKRDLLWYRYGCHAMLDDSRLSSKLDETQRSTKTRVLKDIRSGLSDLALLAQSTAPTVGEVERLLPTGKSYRLKPWITKVDVLDILDLEDLCTVVGYAVDLFGNEYADALLTTIDIYSRPKRRGISPEGTAESAKQL